MINKFHADSLDELLRLVLQIEPRNQENSLYFRGEEKDFGTTALIPSIYREQRHIELEHNYYREMQRFNDHEFSSDKTTFDKLARMQHYNCPTRMIDISEDLMSAVWFSLDKRKDGETSALYAIEINKEKIKYYDSDAVSVVANLAKSPLDNNNNPEKSKRAIWRDAREHLGNRCDYNLSRMESHRYLMHDIKEEKSWFENNINPEHLFSIFCVKPKYSNQRILGQKGAFLLFGLNHDDVSKPIALLGNECNCSYFRLDERYHPIEAITKILISSSIKLRDLKRIGITKPYVYPELDKVSEYLKVVSE
jgi:hypothetical protein